MVVSTLGETASSAAASIARLACCAAGVLLAAGVAFSGSPETKAERAQDSRDRLKEVQRELGREREKVKEAARKEASLSRELTALEDDVKAKTKLLRELEAKLRGSSALWLPNLVMPAK